MGTSDLPLVSVIIPVRNGLPWVVDAVRSAADQSWPAIEIVIVDDRSSDNTVNAINSLNLKNVVILKGDGRGACAARNLGMNASKGRFLQFLDADDLLGQDKIERQIKMMLCCSNSDRIVSYSRLTQFRNDSDPAKGESWHVDERSFDPPLKLLSEILELGRFVQTGQWLTPRRLIEQAGNWDESLQADQDGDFFSRVLSNAVACYSCPTAVAYYRRITNSHQISAGKTAGHFQSRFIVLQRKIRLIERTIEKSQIQKIVENQCGPLATSSFPSNVDVSKGCIELMNQFGVPFEPKFPTKALRIIASIFGWKAARYCSYLKHAGRG